VERNLRPSQNEVVTVLPLPLPQDGHDSIPRPRLWQEALLPCGRLPANIRSLTLEGHSYARFRRAFDSRNVTAALSTASELEHVGLSDALELCLLLRDKEPTRFERGALRWHGRYRREVADVTLDEGQAVLALLAALRGSRAPAAARSLADLFDRRSLLQASEALLRWADAST
jgi:hypothetical protein